MLLVGLRKSVAHAKIAQSLLPLPGLLNIVCRFVLSLVSRYFVTLSNPKIRFNHLDPPPITSCPRQCQGNRAQLHFHEFGMCESPGA